jgi:CheY-like chemotaxis protein
VCGPRIAVVEDDQWNLQLIQVVLEDEGYEVVAEMDQHEGHALVKQHGPSLLILDLMQGHDPIGLQVLELLKLDPETHDLPVIILSADAPTLRAHAEQFRAAGVVTLEKPFSVEELLILVRSRVGAARALTFA